MKFRKYICAALMAFVVPIAFASEEQPVIMVNYNGVPVEFDVLPQLIDGRTLVPLRAVFEAMDAEVKYEDETQKITAVRDNITIEMTVGENYIRKVQKPVAEGQAVVSDELVTENIEIDVAPLIIDGRTLVPVRAVSDSFECTVEWVAETYTVNVISQ